MIPPSRTLVLARGAGPREDVGDLRAHQEARDLPGGGGGRRGHGGRRALRAAFALIDDTPCPDKVEQVARHARGFGAVELTGQLSCCIATEGRATVRTDW